MRKKILKFIVKIKNIYLLLNEQKSKIIFFFSFFLIFIILFTFKTDIFFKKFFQLFIFDPITPACLIKMNRFIHLTLNIKQSPWNISWTKSNKIISFDTTTNEKNIGEFRMFTKFFSTFFKFW